MLVFRVLVVVVVISHANVFVKWPNLFYNQLKMFWRSCLADDFAAFHIPKETWTGPAMKDESQWSSVVKAGSKRFVEDFFATEEKKHKTRVAARSAKEAAAVAIAEADI